MLMIRRTGPVLMSVLAAMTLALPAVLHSAQPRLEPVAETVIASPARPVGYAAQVGSQSDPSRYVGLIEAGGATSLRDDVSWASVEPARGRFIWSGPDEIVTQAAEHHLHALLVIDTTPPWASGGSASNPGRYWLPPRNPADYGVFAADVAARYAAGGTFWKEHPGLPVYLLAGVELWNEENLKLFWGGATPDPHTYAAMVTAAYGRIKQVDPSMTVVLGGLAPGGAYNDVTCSGHVGTGHDAAAWNGVNYLQALYADGIHGHFDAIAWHPYNFWKGATATQMLTYNPCSAWSQMATTPVSVRSLMVARGDAAKSIWITEAGAPTCVTGATYTCVSPTVQADLATAETSLWRSYSWAGGFYWYDIRDDSLGMQYAASHFGAVTPDDSPKPAYHALQQAWTYAPKQQSPLTLTVPESRGVRSVAFSPDDKVLAAGDGNGHVYLWQVSTHGLVNMLTDPGSKGVSSVTFNPGSSLLAVGDANGHVYLWEGNELLATLAVPSRQAVSSVVFSPDGTFLAAGDAKGNAYIWQVNTRALVSSLTDPRSKGISEVAFNPADSLLAAGDANGNTYLWSHGPAGSLTDPSSGGVRSVAFSSDNKYLVAGDSNGKAYVWLVSSHHIAQSLTDPAREGIDSVAFNPSDTLLATADTHGHIYLWTSGAEHQQTLTDPSSTGVHSVAFSPDGQYLAAADANGHVYLWPVTT
jgi:polysaccharide biosynthesis protein PslG